MLLYEPLIISEYKASPTNGSCDNKLLFKKCEKICIEILQYTRARIACLFSLGTAGLFGLRSGTL